MQDLNFTPFTRTSSLARSPSRPGRNDSLLRANRESLAHLGQRNEVSPDPKGRLLRQLRLNAGLDPSDLATRACISLAQLYEIETGSNTLFYSTSLREQAARRVARLLSTDWDNLGTMPHALQCNSNVVKLQWPCTSKLASAATNRPITSAAEPEDEDQEPAPLGLSTPCASTIQSAQQQAAETQQPRPRSRWASIMIWMLVALLLSAATFHAINEWSPYRLIWPWETAWPWKLSLPLTS